MYVDTPRAFRQALGHRAVINTPSGQWAGGPFYLDVSLLNAAVTNTNLTVHDAWWGDPQVRQAYALTDGDVATRVKASLHLEAAMLLLTKGTSAKLDVDTLQNLFGSTTAPYLTATVGTSVRKIPLVGAIHHALELRQITQAAAANGEFATIKGRPHVLPSPIRIDLENDAFTLNSDAAVALGADEACKLVLFGAIYPGSVGIPGFLPGANCTDDGDRQVPIGDLRGQSIQAVGVYRPYGF